MSENIKRRRPGRKAVIILLILVAVIGLVLLGGRLYFRLPVGDYYAASSAAFPIPGLESGFVPQGLCLDEESGCYLVGGYRKGGEASPVYAVNRASGEVVARVDLANPDGTAFTGHAGGLAVWGDNVYVAGGSCLYVFDRMAILFAGTGGEPVQWLNRIEAPALPGEDDYVGISWVDIRAEGDEALLTVGEFYRDPNYPTPESHKFTAPDGERLQALGVTCRLSEDGLSLTPVKAYALPDLVQGFTLHEGRIWLSASWGTAFSHILAYEESALEPLQTLTLGGQEVPLYPLGRAARAADYKIAPMAEEIIFDDGRLLTMCESASRKYYFGILTGAQWCYATDLAAMTPAQ